MKDEVAEAAARMFAAGDGLARRGFALGVEWGRAHPLPGPQVIYAAFEPCGCMCVAQFRGGQLPEYGADSVIVGWLDEGLYVHRVTDEEYRALPLIGQCPHQTAAEVMEGVRGTGDGQGGVEAGQ